jgi:hypothetical protein
MGTLNGEVFLGDYMDLKAKDMGFDHSQASDSSEALNRIWELRVEIPRRCRE